VTSRTHEPDDLQSFDSDAVIYAVAEVVEFSMNETKLTNRERSQRTMLQKPHKPIRPT